MIIYEAFVGQVGSSISFVLVLQGDRETFAATGGDGMWQRSRAGLGDRPSVSACVNKHMTRRDIEHTHSKLKKCEKLQSLKN